jgi:hypothetical protein
MPGDTVQMPVKSAPRGEVAAVQGFDWSSVATNDLRAYIRNLRAIRCPEPTVRDIIVAEVNREFAPREAPYRLALSSPAIDGSETTAQRRERMKADYQRRRSLRLIEKEKVAVIRDLLGFEPPLEPLRGWHGRNYERMEAAINAVPAEKRERVREVLEAYWELSDRLNDERDARNGVRDAAFIERYRENNERRRLGLSQVLSPEEVETFDMRASGLAERLGANLADFKPSEAEFREIWRMRREIDEPFGGTMTTGDVSDWKPDPEAETRYRAGLERLLGPERLAEYDRANNPHYQNLAGLRDRFGLSQEQIDQAWGLLGQTEPGAKVPGGESTPSDELVRPGGGGRPPEEAWRQIGELIGQRPFQVLEAMIPAANAEGGVPVLVKPQIVRPSVVPARPGP